MILLSFEDSEFQVFLEKWVTNAALTILNWHVAIFFSISYVLEYVKC